MKNFEFCQVIKITSWKLQNFVIEAKTKEEAIEKAKQFANKDVDNCDVYVNVWKSDWIGNAKEKVVLPEENGGESTIKVYDNEDSAMKLIAQNGK